MECPRRRGRLRMQLTPQDFGARLEGTVRTGAIPTARPQFHQPTMRDLVEGIVSEQSRRLAQGSGEFAPFRQRLDQQMQRRGEIAAQALAFLENWIVVTTRQQIAAARFDRGFQRTTMFIVVARLFGARGLRERFLKNREVNRGRRIHAPLDRRRVEFDEASDLGEGPPQVMQLASQVGARLRFRRVWPEEPGQMFPPLRRPSMDEQVGEQRPQPRRIDARHGAAAIRHAEIAEKLNFQAEARHSLKILETIRYSQSGVSPQNSLQNRGSQQGPARLDSWNPELVVNRSSLIV